MDTEYISSKSNIEMLCDAALQGDVELLLELLEKDPYILHRPPSVQISVLPLHLASKLGHVRFALQILRHRQDLVSTVDPLDQSSTPLHLAARSGNQNMVRCLLAAKPCICFARDSQGRNPIHVAAEQGHVDVLVELAQAFPAAARERVRCHGVGSKCSRDGDTIMHLCVKQGNLDMLMLIVEKVLLSEDDYKTMLNARDEDGNTILHWAVAIKQLKIIEYLLADRRIHKNSRNLDGLTPMDMLFCQSNRSDNELDQRIKDKLEQAKALSSADLRQSTSRTMDFGSWVEKKQSGLMVVASLIATMAFQACINPPPYLVSKDGADSSKEKDHGLIDDVRSKFVISNTVGFVFSMCSIALLITGLRFNKVRVLVFVMVMWVAVTSMIVVYHISSAALTEPGLERGGGIVLILLLDIVLVGIFGAVFVCVPCLSRERNHR